MDALSQAALGHPWDARGRSVEQIVSRLRAKLGDIDRRIIQSVRGRGYVLAGPVREAGKCARLQTSPPSCAYFQSRTSASRSRSRRWPPPDRRGAGLGRCRAGDASVRMKVERRQRGSAADAPLGRHEVSTVTDNTNDHTPVPSRTPTAAEFAALLAEYRAADAAFATLEDAATPRYQAARRALFTTRPTDPRVMALQLRWLVTEMDPDDSGHGDCGSSTAMTSSRSCGTSPASSRAPCCYRPALRRRSARRWSPWPSTWGLGWTQILAPSLGYQSGCAISAACCAAPIACSTRPPDRRGAHERRARRAGGRRA
jgi:hypothetical protein